MQRLKERGMDMDSFLLIGQSNMAGRGDFGEVEEIENPKCWMLRNGRWQIMREPINPDRMILQGYFGEYQLHSGVGPGASFADAYANHFQRDVGLIPCADGGTELNEWMPGELLYDHAVMQAKLAMRTSELKGILWHQGEYDSTTKEKVEVYHDKFLHMIGSLKRDIGISEETPVILGELGEFIEHFEQGKYKWAPVLNEKFREIQHDIPMAGLVEARGLEARFDGLHFSSRAYRELGRRYFAKYLELVT